MRPVLDHVVLVTAVIVFCGPVIWLLGSTLTPDVLVENWQSLNAQLSEERHGPGLARMILVNFALATLVAVLTTVFSFFAAYVFTFFERPFLGFVFWAILATLYFPVEARMLQTFDVIVVLNLTNSLAGLALPVLQLALGTLFFRQRLKQLPSSVFEAARLDAAGPVRCIFDIALPLCWPAVVTVLLVTFIIGWNQYLWPLMASVDDRHWTLVRALERVRTGSDEGRLLAAMSLLPPLALVLLFRRSLTLGVLLGTEGSKRSTNERRSL